MNWFEDDNGSLINLDLVTQITSPDLPRADGEATLSYTTGDQLYLTRAEWLRLRAQLYIDPKAPARSSAPDLAGQSQTTPEKAGGSR